MEFRAKNSNGVKCNMEFGRITKIYQRRGPEMSAGASHDNPRTPNVHMRGSRRFKHHQNSTRKPSERQKERKWEREGKKSAKFCSPTLRGPTLRGAALRSPTIGAPPFGAHPSGPHPWGAPFGAPHPCFFCPVCHFLFCPECCFFFVPFVFFLSRMHLFIFVPTTACLFCPVSVFFLSRGVFFGSSETNGVTSSGGSLCWWTCVGRLARRFIMCHTCSCSPFV